jgi:hypothetical protein
VAEKPITALSRCVYPGDNHAGRLPIVFNLRQSLIDIAHFRSCSSAERRASRAPSV